MLQLPNLFCKISAFRRTFLTTSLNFSFLCIFSQYIAVTATSLYIYIYCTYMYIYKYISLEINFAILHNINCTVYQYIYIPWIFPFLSYTYLWILLLQPLSAYPYFISLLHTPTTYTHLQMAAALKYQNFPTSKWQLLSNINMFSLPNGSPPQISTYSHLQMAATLKYQPIHTSR